MIALNNEAAVVESNNRRQSLPMSPVWIWTMPRSGLLPFAWTSDVLVLRRTSFLLADRALLATKEHLYFRTCFFTYTT